jgi:hypothetical protein
MLSKSVNAIIGRVMVSGALFFTSACHLADNTDDRMKLIDECRADFDKNAQPDLALLFDRAGEVTLTVFLARDGSYEEHLLKKSQAGTLRAKCASGYELVETLAGAGKTTSKKVVVDGSYVVLHQEESSSVAFYWADGQFHELWLSD